MQKELSEFAHTFQVEEALNQFNTTSSGLTQAEVAERLAKFGENSLPVKRAIPPWLRFVKQFHNPLIYVLIAAGIVTVLLEDYIDATVIVAVVLVNAMIGFVQEGKAEKALEAVRAMLASHARVLRDHQHLDINANQLVPGDIVILEPGDKVPADLRLISVKSFYVMEAALTGESLPVEKSVISVPKEANLGDRTCMVYSGTLVSMGHAHGVVVATGQSTEVGKIGHLVSEVQTLATPLTRRLDWFAKQITTVILCIGLITFAYGYWVMHMPILDLFLAIVGLSVAAIPEGLPAVVTIVLAIGTRIMAKNKAIIRRLPAIETLGSVTVICSDKTGTLTRNEMSAVSVMLPNATLKVSGSGYQPEGTFLYEDDTPVDIEHADELIDLLVCATLCNDAQIKQDEAGIWRMVGDPTEGALQAMASKGELDANDMKQRYPRIDEIPFESERQWMATLHHHHQGRDFILIKGAPEKILKLCLRDAVGELDHAKWEARIANAASNGQRVLALAKCDLDENGKLLCVDDITTRFSLLGMVGMIDPPRQEAIEAVAECQSAGLRVMMITGDHEVTATAIAKQLGLAAKHTLNGSAIEALSDSELRQMVGQVDVVARASPQHKLRLVEALQAEGEIVAMTGDGVNDAPAIKAADIGVAMGGKGTDAAREAADLVLTDDNFATITNAVKEGRVVFDNIKKALLFILPTNGGQAGVILIALFLGIALPITAGQILWVNMVTAVTLALALAFELAEPNIMKRLPRSPKEPLITKVIAIRILYVSILMIAVTFAIFEWELARGSSMATARTSAVNMLVVGELVYLFNVRYFTASSFHWHVFTGNRVAIVVSLLLLGFQMIFTYTSFMHQFFGSESLDWMSWFAICILGFVKFVAVEVEKVIWRMKKVSII
ncbi:MAG: HAD-IC family P-type ATPase [Methylophilus sp.]|nr:HAD-IC family P-type ATPase [Methylophilus sp.]